MASKVGSDETRVLYRHGSGEVDITEWLGKSSEELGRLERELADRQATAIAKVAELNFQAKCLQDELAEAEKASLERTAQVEALSFILDLLLEKSVEAK